MSLLEKQPVARLDYKKIDSVFLRRALDLWYQVWPDKKGRSEDELVELYMNQYVYEDSLESRTGVFHYLESRGKIVAIARTFLREILFCEHSEKRSVLALASVCTSPNHRGEGLGRWIVEDIFLRLEEEKISCSLFQTPVPRFYEKFGSELVENVFVDSTNEEYPDSNPWWEEHVMIRPGSRKWLEGRVDLKGKGY